MGWDGMGWDGMGWDGMGWDGTLEAIPMVCIKSANSWLAYHYKCDVLRLTYSK